MLSFLTKLFRKEAAGLQHPEHAFSVRDDGEAIYCRFLEGAEQSVRWTDLEEIRIITTDEGPMLPDVFWRFSAEAGEVVFPQMALGEQEVVSRAMKLPGYDFEQSMAAMRTATNAEFVVWRVGRKLPNHVPLSTPPSSKPAASSFAGPSTFARLTADTTEGRDTPVAPPSGAAVH